MPVHAEKELHYFMFSVNNRNMSGTGMNKEKSKSETNLFVIMWVRAVEAGCPEPASSASHWDEAGVEV